MYLLSGLSWAKVYANVRFLEEMFDISNKLSAISREKISRLKRSSASLRAFSPMRRALFGMVGDVADSVYPALYIVIFYGNADFFLVDVDFEVGVA